jgi:hypothetical protein
MHDTTPFAHIPAWSGAPVRDRDGKNAGHIVEVRFDELTHAPAAFVVAQGTRHALVPAPGAVSLAGFVRVPYATAEIWGAAAPATQVQLRPAALAA